MSVEISTPGKKLSELRVIDLKQELDKRGLEKTGVKASLLDRLKKALENEGEDPEQYVFNVCGGKKSKNDDSMLEESEEQTEDKKGADDILTEIDLDGVDCEIGDDSIDLGDFVETDVESTKQDQEQELNEKSETAPEEQKQELSMVMETCEDKTEFKPEAPEIKVEEVNPSQSSNAENSQQETAICKQEADKENLLSSFDLAPPTPTSMPVIAPFTSDDTIKMDTSSERKEDDISLIVHVDESMNEFDMPETPSRSVTSDTGSTQGASSEVLDKTIEEKAAADAEKAFLKKTGDEQPVVEDVTPVVNTEAITGQGDLKEKEAKMDTETTSEAQDKAKQGTETATTANSDASPNKETSSAAGDSKTATKKPDAKSKSSVNSRNLWISGLSTSTRATDLKALFSKYGKVAGAKVVTNARSPGSKCYGFVSMNTAEEASKCIQYLHRTELHGRMISVERAKTDPSQAKAITAPKKSTKPSESKEEEQKKEAEKKDEKESEKKEGEKEKKEADKKDGDKKDEKKTPDSRRHSSGDRRHSHGSSRPHRRRSRSPVRSRGHSRHHSSKDRTTREKDPKKEEVKKDGGHEKEKEQTVEKKETEGKSEEKKTGEEKPTETKKGEEKKDEKKKSKEKEMLSLEKIKEERERERLRQRERRLREEERRRREVADRERVRQREIMARQREEAVRLQRERERLKLERERLEREKLEAEREKLRLERERRERERQELAEQRRLEALRYEERQRAMKRPYENRGNDDYWGEPKRATYEQRDRYSDYDGRPQGGYNDQRDRGYQQDRQVDRYDRNGGRAVERDQRGFERRDEPRGGQTRGGAAAADRRDIRRDQPQSRDRDDRNRADDRYNKYESERDTRRDVPVRDHDRREQRRPSPHRPAPRDSPTRRNDTGSSGYRAAAPTERQSRDRAHENRAASDRAYAGHGANQRGGDQNAWQSNNTGAPRDAKDNRSYPRGGGAHSASNGPGATNILGTSAGASTWAAPDRRPAGHMVVQQTADPRGWQTVTSVAPRTVVNTPILQPAPTTNAFLASAANIMMGVGLARGGDTRYDAYKTLPANIRRY